MRKLLLAGIVLVWANVAFAQDKTLSGKVTSSKDGSSLSGVSVKIKGTDKGATTDENGIYKIIASGNASLIFKLNKFKAQKVKVEYRTILDVQLVPRRRSGK